MQVYEIHGPCRLYWFAEMNDLFPKRNFNKVMSYKRFEKILLFLRLSNGNDEDQQVLHFLANINQNFQNSVIPGSYLTLDESMMKSFHLNVKVKIKIIRKPHLVGNTIKNIPDGASQIVFYLELHEGKDIMSQKDYAKLYGATAATTLELTSHTLLVVVMSLQTIGLAQ